MFQITKLCDLMNSHTQCEFDWSINVKCTCVYVCMYCMRACCTCMYICTYECIYCVYTCCVTGMGSQDTCTYVRWSCM